MDRDWVRSGFGLADFTVAMGAVHPDCGGFSRIVPLSGGAAVRRRDGGADIDAPRGEDGGGGAVTMAGDDLRAGWACGRIAVADLCAMDSDDCHLRCLPVSV